MSIRGVRCEAMAAGPGGQCMRRGATRCSWTEDDGTRVTKLLCTTHRFVYSKKKREFQAERP